MSWQDDMRECCQHEDFRQQLPRLLIGEDAHIRRIPHEAGYPHNA